MSNVKITDLPSLTGALSNSLDVLPVVDVSGDATSKMTRAEFFKNVPAIDLIGAITTGSWNGAAITAPYGGTGITSYAIGDLVYASTTSALSKLADVATGNALISGGVGAAPAYGKIGLTTHVSGTLPVANGGTGVTTSTGSGANVLGTGPTITGAALNGTLGATTASTVAATTITATTSILSSGAGGIGYSTGAGVAVTQLTSRTTAAPTTGAKTSGAVTLFTAAAVVNTYFTFTVPNTAIAVTDTVVVTVRGATNTYVAFVSAIVAGTSFNVTMASVAGVASDTPIVNFTIIKGVSA